MQKEKNNKGITLTALIITIIVMLILASVVIWQVVSEDGLIKKVLVGTGRYNDSQAREELEVNLQEWRIEKYTNASANLKTFLEGKGYTVTEEGEDAYKVSKDGYEFSVDKDLTTESLRVEGIQISLVEEKQNVTVTAGGNVKEVTSDGVPIPQGFYYVGGTIDEGVVVSDNANDANKGTSFETAQTLEGNQFVWVPVRSSKIKTNIRSEKEIESIVVTDSSNKNTYNLDANNAKTYNQDFWPGRSETYTFTVTDTEGNVETKDITITNVNGPIYWDNNGQKVGQLWATSTGENFGTKNSTYSADGELREPDVVVSYDGNTTYLKTALGVASDEELKTALSLDDLSDTLVNANAFKTILQNEFNQMTTSVNNYGGFYVGRYETGGFNTPQCVVKAGEGDYSINRVDWYTMYNKNKTLSTTSVASTLIWGCQYDAMCNWLTNPSRTKLNDTRYSASMLETGAISSDIDKNIYDLAGNVSEVTMTARGSIQRRYRGGSINTSYSVAGGWTFYPDSGYYDYYGTRSTLYIK